MERVRTTEKTSNWARWLPVVSWSRTYNREQWVADTLAAGIVTLMLIPQSLAYAMLAGLPPQAGLYASMLPLVVYALLGSSRTLAVGPAAITSLMTAAAIGQLDLAGPGQYWGAVLILSMLSGLILLGMGVMRLGWLANYLSHPVVSGFISASGILIALSQAKYLLGITVSGDTLWELIPAFWRELPNIHAPTLLLGGLATGFLVWSRSYLQAVLMRAGLTRSWSATCVKAAPIVAIIITTFVVWYWDLAESGVKVVGTVPQGLPGLTWPVWDTALWKQLFVPALLLSVVGFVESISVGQTLAARRRQRIKPDQELVALGASNVAAALSAGLPVTGGFSRSVVNFEAGAQTQAAGLYSAVGIAIAAFVLTPLLYYLPQAILAATIIVAVWSLVDFRMMQRTWRYSRFDFSVVLATFLVTLMAGVEPGLVIGVSLALVVYLYRSSRPHVAVVGWIPGTEHFRNVLRHTVKTSAKVLGVRIDESLYFANARFLEDRLNAIVAECSELEHVVLQCSAINDIDASALESLEAIEVRLKEAGICLHLSEVKGPVMDKLQNTLFLQHLSGRVFLTHYQAITALAPDLFETPGHEALAASHHTSSPSK